MTDALLASYERIDGGVVEFDAVVSADGGSGFESIAAAFAAGKTRVFVRAGTYVETSDIVIPEDGSLVGESIGGAIVVLASGAQVKIDGSARQTTAGTLAASNGSATITGSGTSFTSVQAGDRISVQGAWHEIASVETDTSLTLTAIYRGDSFSGAPFVAQSMIVGAEISKVVLANSTVSALAIRQALNVLVRDTLVVGSGAAGVHPAVTLDWCGEVFWIGCIVRNALHHGIAARDSSAMLFDTCGVFNGVGDGFLFDNTTDVNLDSSFSLQNGGDGFSSEGTSARINLTACVLSRNFGKGANTEPGTGSSIIDSCTVQGNNRDGVDFDGVNNVVNDCIIEDNDGVGVMAGDSGVVSGNHIMDNGGVGINASNDDGCVLTGNIVKGNAGDGIRSGPNCTVSCNVVTGNGGNGIEIGGGVDDAIVSGNRCSGNTGSGIHVFAGSSRTIVTSNNVTGNTGSGFVDEGDATVAANNVT